MRTFKKYDAAEINAHYRNAVVNITSTVGFTGTVGLTGANYSGNGFFITKRHFVVAPAHLVIAPPNIGALRFPAFTGTGPVPMTNILVTVFNVNCTRDTFVYNATLIGVDGAGDIALLKLNDHNCEGPKIKHCHPYFKFGDSLKYSPGNTVYSIGDLGLNQDFRSVSQGIVRNNKYFDAAGLVVYEGISTTLPYNAQRVFSAGLVPAAGTLVQLIANDGAPIIDVTGRIVGMVTTSTNILATQIPILIPTVLGISINNEDDLALGVSQRFMRCVLRALIKSYCRGEPQHQTVLVTDAALGTTYYNYRKGFLGATYDLVNGRFFAGVLGGGITGATGAACRRVVGIAYHPFGVTGALGITGTVSNGDILSHVNCVEIGNLADQLPLTTLNWRHIAGECARFTYVTQSSLYSVCNEVKATYTDFPFALDYSPLFFNAVASGRGVI